MAAEQEAYFGLGCFWEPDSEFSQLDGVTETEVGYAGGELDNPSYELVCGGSTGHTETVRVVFDPEQISYQELVDQFFEWHNPEHQYKTQYQSVIFYLDSQQKKVAENAVADQERIRGRKIATIVLPLGSYFRAEEYHQKFLEKNR